MKREQIIAASVTAVITLIIVALMILSTITADLSQKEWPPRHDSDITLDEYAELLDYPATPTPANDDPAPALLDQESDANAQAAPQPGMDLTDNGPAGDAPRPVTSDREAPVKAEKTEKPAKEGPAIDTKAREQEQARRKAQADTKSAFSKSNAHNNTNNASANANGNAGKPSGASSAVNGTGSGRAGGGWHLPSYAPVPSNVTGKIMLSVKIDKSGHVTAVTFTGGTPPAATNRDLRAAVEREVRSRRFTRSDDNAPDEATAHITYIFK